MFPSAPRGSGRGYAARVKTGTVVLDIERIVAGGFGLARTPDGAVLVRGALPGERVTARPKMVAGAMRAHAISIEVPHPARVTLDLPPGADLPLDYGAQLPVKKSLVVEALTRIAKLSADVDDVVPSPRALGYRSVAQYVVVPGGGLGARAVGSDRVVPLSADPLIAEPAARAFAACERTMNNVHEVVIRASIHEDRALVALIGDKSGPFDRHARALTSDATIAGVTWAEADERGRFRGRTKLLAGRAHLLEDLGGVLASVTVGTFSQVNPLAAGALFAAAANAAGDGVRALDLYAGSGILGMHLARSFDTVVGVEIAADAVRRGESDARRLGIANITFARADARTAGRLFPADVVVVDPPRAGLSDEVVALLKDKRPARIVYVSCDPTTWARDVARLVADGYRLSLVRPYDLYPFTHHVEVLSVLER